VRVVSLLPSATEIVAALGALDELVGVTHECDFPPEVASRARVTACDVDADATPGAIDTQVRTLTGEGRSLYTLDETRIRALRPDLIVTQALCAVCAVMETDVRALAERLVPAPAVVSLSATTLDGVFVDIERAGAAIGRESEAATLGAALRRRMRAVHDTLSAARAPRPRVAVIEWTDPVFAAGHWVPEMVRRAGGIDVLASGGEHSRVVPVGRIHEAGAEIVVFAPCGYGLEHAASEARALLADPDWSFLEGCDVWALDANALTSRPGPRLVDGIEVMARIFNAPLFSPLDPSHARVLRAHEPSRT
jgi:iron complex transport system substrate-binding protein